MYQIANITPAALAKVKIRHQSKILELTGSKFDPVNAFRILSKETKGFTEQNAKVQQADALFVELLKLNGITLKKPAVDNATRIRIQEQERTRALELLELELELDREHSQGKKLKL